MGPWPLWLQGIHWDSLGDEGARENVLEGGEMAFQPQVRAQRVMIEKVVHKA